MMGELREVVAKDIYESEYVDSFDTLGGIERELQLQKADAAIAAVKESLLARAMASDEQPCPSCRGEYWLTGGDLATVLLALFDADDPAADAPGDHEVGV